MMKTALISGASGQDGAYLAALLLKKGYRVVGASRDANMASFENLKRLGIFSQVERQSMALTDFRNIIQTLEKVRPDEIYHLAGQSSVALSFDQPLETLQSTSVATLALLEAIRFLGAGIRLYHASSSECFGDTGATPATEDTPFRPRSPYGVAKAAAHWAVVNYRESYGIYAANGILFNHESPLRPSRFVTKKIIQGACRIKAGNGDKLELKALNIQRDWGWAPEYVDAMWRVLQNPQAEDFLIATGFTYSLQDFVEVAFHELGLNWRDHVLVDHAEHRPSDIMVSRANPAKARARLSWNPKFAMPDVVRMMIDAEASCDVR